MSDWGSETLLVVLLFGGGLLVWVLYLVPTIIAFRRRHPDRWLITVTNLLLGASGVGWVAALVWALRLEVPGTEGAGDGHLKNPYRPAVTASASPPTPAAAIAEIERLSALRAAGHLSEAEFAALKAVALRRP